jgi:uncharacterized integral membrane protein
MNHHVTQNLVVPMLSLFAMATLTIFPWVWRWNAPAGVACLAAVLAWAVWLMVLYLRRGISAGNRTDLPERWTATIASRSSVT